MNGILDTIDIKAKPTQKELDDDTRKGYNTGQKMTIHRSAMIQKNTKKCKSLTPKLFSMYEKKNTVMLNTGIQEKMERIDDTKELDFGHLQRSKFM